MGWDYWNVDMQGHALFRRNGPGRRSGGVALYVRQHCLCLGMDDDLWVRKKGWPGRETLLWVFATGHLISRRKQMSPSTCSLKQPQSHRHCFMWGTLTTLTPAEEATQQRRDQQWGRFLESTDDNFHSQVVEDPTRNGILLDFTKCYQMGKALWEMWTAGSSLGHSNREILEFIIRWGESKTKS